MDLWREQLWVPSPANPLRGGGMLHNINVFSWIPNSPLIWNIPQNAKFGWGVNINERILCCTSSISTQGKRGHTSLHSSRSGLSVQSLHSSVWSTHKVLPRCICVKAIAGHPAEVRCSCRVGARGRGAKRGAHVGFLCRRAWWQASKDMLCFSELSQLTDSVLETHGSLELGLPCTTKEQTQVSQLRFHAWSAYCIQGNMLSAFHETFLILKITYVEMRTLPLPSKLTKHVLRRCKENNSRHRIQLLIYLTQSSWWFPWVIDTS